MPILKILTTFRIRYASFNMPNPPTMRLFYLLLALLPLSLFAQLNEVPAPGAPQSGPVLVRNAKIHIGNGEVIENGVLTFAQGKIVLVGDATRVRIDPAAYETIVDAEGKHLYPGLIAMDAVFGLREIDAVRATNDWAEVGYFNPSIRSLIAFSTDSRVVPTIRSRGVLLSQVTPKGGRISGQSSVLHLDGWNWEDAAVNIDEGIHLNWPSLYRRSGWWAEPGGVTRNKDYDKQVQEIASFFAEAKGYAEQTNVSTTNLKMEAMKGLFAKEKTLYIHVDNGKAIMEAVLWAEDYGFKVVLVGARDSWMITDFLKERDIPVVIGQVTALPSSEDADIDQPFKTPAALAEAGIRFAFAMDGSWEYRNLPFQAGQAIAFGLPYERAVQAMTLDAARMLDIDDEYGSLEEGKSATFIMTSGDVFDVRTSKVEAGFIDGRAVNLDNKQTALARKYLAKYGRE